MCRSEDPAEPIVKGLKETECDVRILYPSKLFLLPRLLVLMEQATLSHFVKIKFLYDDIIKKDNKIRIQEQRSYCGIKGLVIDIGFL